MKAIPPLCLLGLAAVRAAAQFTEIDPNIAQPPFPCVVVGDYDGDGDLDVLVAGVGRRDVPFTTIYNNTGGIFTDSGVSLPGLSRASAAWGDYDGDGDLDLAMTGLTSSQIAATRIYRNDGGVFTAIPGSFAPVFAGSVAWGDYDGDGDLDLLVTGVTSATPGASAATRLYRNDGGVFTAVAHPFPNCYLGAVSWGDYDKDGDLDVVITGTESSSALVAGLWRNDGGSFTEAGVNLPGMDLGFALWGDYDNDGDLDLLYSGNSNDGWITRIYRNDGGSFTDANAGLLGLLWSSAACGDYDNDGDLDVMIIGYDPVAQVRRSILYRNDAGAFGDSGVVFHDVYLGTISWIDYDNDGDLDLLLAGNDLGGDVLRLSRNDVLTQNTAPSAPANLVAVRNGTSVIFSWAAGTDSQSPTVALTYNLRVGTTPGGSDIVAAHSSGTGYRRLAAPGNAGQALTSRLRGLIPGTTYYWTVQTADTGFLGSSFAIGGSFTTTGDAPHNVAFTREPEGFRAVWRGTPGFDYRVETSEDLATWTHVGTRTAASGTGLFEFLDIPSANTSKRFYRAAQP